ncbi:MAG: hypothetical protein C0503_09970 [Gemmatimonas sp.]|nr:hypothetical protein [Gemmatimonas sp.]
MLGYLDALIAALSVRDGAEVDRLLAHPLGRLLPLAVRDEARDFQAGGRDALAAPLRAMQLRHQTAELLRDAPLEDRPEPRADDRTEASAELARGALPPTVRARRATRPQQMELPLSA